MGEFFYLEGAYLILGMVILAVTLYVSTRPFMPKGAWKKGLGAVGLFLMLLIGLHYKITTDRIATVKEAFSQDRPIICESRMLRKAAQSVILQRSKGWRLEGNNFVSEAYERPFFVARCIVKE
jgi:hypothetical protein